MTSGGEATATATVKITWMHFIFLQFQMLLRFIFRLIYGVQGRRVPPITDSTLLESASALATKIRNKQLTSVQVVTAYIERIKLVNPLLNCVVDQRFEAALKEAAAVDEQLAAGEHSIAELAATKPFLGVPITTKDCIAVEGLLQTSGLYRRRNVRATQDAVVIALMRQAGAIPLAVTNVSEVCMWWESNNTVHGRTRNPYDTYRIVGGSSGGEGCTLSAAASACGIGSDVGGSIRMPAFFNGIFGHKPTQNVVSNVGQFPMPCTAEQNSFLGTGPMSRYAVDLKPMLRIMSGAQSKLLRLDEPVDLKQLRYYYQPTDGGGRFVSPVDADLLNGLSDVVKHLSSKYTVARVSEVQLPAMRQSCAIWFANMRDNSGHTFAYQLGNLERDINPYVELFKWCFGASKHTFIGLLTAILDATQVKFGSPKHQHLVKKRDELRAQLQQLLQHDGVLIYPTHPTVAPYHNEPILRPMNFSYTAIVNVLGFPATAVPLGKLGREGLPLGVQVIANHNQDRLCLAVAEELERAFGGWSQPK